MSGIRSIAAGHSPRIAIFSQAVNDPKRAFAKSHVRGVS